MKGTVIERFEARVDRDGSIHPVLGSRCWIWTGAKNSKQYGNLNIDGKAVATHRLAWEFAYGPIPTGLSVLHHCDNPPCVNPAHLFLGTTKVNAADMVAKGRSHNQKKDRCVRGHLFDAENTYRPAAGKRACLTCKAARSAAQFVAEKERDIVAARAKWREGSRRWRKRHDTAADRAKTRAYAAQWRAARRMSVAA